MAIYHNLSLTIIEKPDAKHHGGYTYLIGGIYSYRAFKTKNGFEQWLKRSNVKLELVERRETEQYGSIDQYKINGTIEERLFWKLSELPEGAIQYKDLSNGSLVDCYYIQTDNGSIVYRPNPNAKEVYKPLPLNEHIAYQKKNG